MSSDISAQVDVGSLSLSGLKQVAGILSVLSADDVQPMAMLQLQDLGTLFSISGPVASKVPDYLLRCKSVRIERLGYLVGWRKGDSASLMAQSTGGQAVALLSVCLWSLYQESTGDILHTISSAILPQSARASSPGILERAAKILADKLQVVGFGTILAKQVCRIHDAYENLKERVPCDILESLSQDWMAEFLIGVSRALREENAILRVRGCYGLGYISALMVTLFPDDCTVTIEKIVVHVGKNTSSITVDIVGPSCGTLPEVHFMETVESIADVLLNPGKAEYRYRDKFATDACFSWEGHIAASLRLELQHKGFLYSSEVVELVGVCALAMSDCLCIEYQGLDPEILAVSILGDSYRAKRHKRCEIAMGVQLPSTWPPLGKAMKLLFEVKSSELKSSPHWNITASSIAGMAVGATFKALFFNPHEQVTVKGIFSQEQSILGQFGEWTDPRNWSSDGVLEAIFPDLNRKGLDKTIAKSLGASTYVPSTYLTLRDDDICHYRSIEIFDGPIIFNGRYYGEVNNPTIEESNAGNLCELGEKANIVPSSEGCVSQVSFTARERLDEVLLEATLMYSGQKISVSLAKRMRQLFCLIKTTQCEHPRTTPLKEEYCKRVLTASALSPDPPRGSIAIVQTAGDPVAQILALSPGARAILCYRCCLNCAFEQAQNWKARKIIVA